MLIHRPTQIQISAPNPIRFQIRIKRTAAHRKCPIPTTFRYKVIQFTFRQLQTPNQQVIMPISFKSGGLHCAHYASTQTPPVFLLMSVHEEVTFVRVLPELFAAFITPKINPVLGKGDGYVRPVVIQSEHILTISPAESNLGALTNARIYISGFQTFSFRAALLKF